MLPVLSGAVLTDGFEGAAETETKLEGPAGEVAVFTVTGDSVAACNMNGKQEVGITESKWDGKGAYVFPKHSLTLLRWKA